jgi:hypothetical protein
MLESYEFEPAIAYAKPYPAPAKTRAEAKNAKKTK